MPLFDAIVAAGRASPVLKYGRFPASLVTTSETLGGDGGDGEGTPAAQHLVSVDQQRVGLDAQLLLHLVLLLQQRGQRVLHVRQLLLQVAHVGAQLPNLPEVVTSQSQLYKHTGRGTERVVSTRYKISCTSSRTSSRFFSCRIT